MLRAQRRLWVFGLLVIGIAGSWLLASPLAAAEDTPTPTVTFTATGLVPVACGTRPDASSLSIPDASAVVVANRTGVSAAVVVGGQRQLTVADGEGASLTLTPGQHEIRLVPQCVLVTQTKALVVTVTSAPPEPPAPSATPDAPATSGAADPSSTPPATDPPPASDPPPGVTPPPATPDPPAQPGTPPQGGSPGDPEPGAGAGHPRATAADPELSSGAGPIAASPTPGPWPSVEEFSGVRGADVLRADPVALAGGSHSKGLRLLAVVATICVLGVTVAIIRTIVRLSP